MCDPDSCTEVHDTADQKSLQSYLKLGLDMGRSGLPGR